MHSVLSSCKVLIGLAHKLCGLMKWRTGHLLLHCSLYNWYYFFLNVWQNSPVKLRQGFRVYREILSLEGNAHEPLRHRKHSGKHQGTCTGPYPCKTRKCTGMDLYSSTCLRLLSSPKHKPPIHMNTCTNRFVSLPLQSLPSPSGGRFLALPKDTSLLRLRLFLKSTCFPKDTSIYTLDCCVLKFFSILGSWVTRPISLGAPQTFSEDISSPNITLARFMNKVLAALPPWLTFKRTYFILFLPLPDLRKTGLPFLPILDSYLSLHTHHRGTSNSDLGRHQKVSEKTLILTSELQLWTEHLEFSFWITSLTGPCSPSDGQNHSLCAAPLLLEQ